ncbi:MAG: hypothetical protein K2F77_09180, partial [Muribaculaceae bacterium]|nr:hypothetical protein [Muribaculaceae bacterium]
ARGLEMQSGSGGNLSGMIWDTRLGNDSTEIDNDTPVEFSLDPESRQLLVMLFPTDSVNSNLLLYEIARHNFRSFVVKDFELEPMNFGRLGIIVIRAFSNMDELNHYRRVMGASADFRLPSGVRPVVISADNFDTLLRAHRSFDDYFRYLDEQNYIDAQADLLQPELIETLPEAEEAEAEAAEAVDVSSDESSPAPEEKTDILEEDIIVAPAPVLLTRPTPASAPSPVPDDGGSEGDDPLFFD